VTAGKHLRNGLNPDGTIAREGALTRVPGAFRAVVEVTRTELATAFGGRRMHSAYLYGSIPRGTAIPGTSDLDVLVALNDEPTPADRSLADGVERGLDRAFAVISGVGLLLYSAATLLSELERHDLGFFVACLCTPLIGPDLGGQLPRYRPTSLLARETNGDLALVIPLWRSRLAEAGTAQQREQLRRGVARRLVRTGFTLVMPRWDGWTSDLAESAEAFAAYYPQRGGQMRAAARAGRTLAATPGELEEMINDLAPWLAAEYTAVHGTKASRETGLTPAQALSPAQAGGHVLEDRLDGVGVVLNAAFPQVVMYRNTVHESM
jgi:nucleotidyltransferase-like protein